MAPPRFFTKTQICQLKIEDLKTTLSERGLDTSGSRIALQKRLRLEIHPDLSSQSDMSQVTHDLDESGLNVLLKFREGAVYKRIPKASRLPACLAFTKILQSVINKNDIQSWSDLFNFARCAMGSSPRGGKNHKSQATVLNKRLEAFMLGNDVSLLSKPSSTKARKMPTLKNQVSTKMAVADIQGAVRILTSKETILPYSLETSNKLKEKHPHAHPESQMASIPDDSNSCFKTNKENLLKALRSFKKGAGGGPDGFLPQHLLDMCGDTLGEPASKLLDTLVSFMNLIVFPGKVPNIVRETFYGANLIALSKEDGGIRPIAVGFTLRRLAKKIVMFGNADFRKAEFQPCQLGVGTPKGAESAIHALRAYLVNLASQDKVVLKIDFKNAFNCIRRDKILALVKLKIPNIYNFVYQC